MTPTKQLYYHIACLVAGNILNKKRHFHINGIKRAINQIIAKSFEYQQYTTLF